MGEGLLVVGAEEGDGVVIDVGDEARGGVEVCVGGFIFSSEVGAGVGKGRVAGSVGACVEGGA